MSSFGGAAICGNRSFSRRDDPVRIVDAERRLRQIGDLALVGNFERRHVLGRLDQHDRLGRLAHRADHFVVPLVADQQDRVARFGVLDRFQVDLGHQRAGGVDRPQLPLAGHRGESRATRRGPRTAASRPAGTSASSSTNVTPRPRKWLDDVLVVDDLVVDVDRRAERAERQLERLDRHVDAGTKPARTRQEDLHVLHDIPSTPLGTVGLDLKSCGMRLRRRCRFTSERR